MSEVYEIQLVTWETGHTLSRVLRGRRDKSVFRLRAPDDTLLYVLLVNPLARLGQGWSEVDLHVASSEMKPPQDFRLHQQLLVSAIVEVLGLPMHHQLTEGPLLAPKPKWVDHLTFAREKSDQLQWIGMHMEVEGDIKRTAEMRRDYMKLAAQQLGSVSIDGASKWLNQQDRTEPLFTSSTTVKRKVAGADWNLKFRIVMSPKLRCLVYLEHERATPTVEGMVILGESSISPLEAILDAQLIVPALPEDWISGKRGRRGFQDALDTWADQVLETAPELTERFDMEPYRLLTQPLPYVWDLDDFTAWAKTMGALS